MMAPTSRRHGLRGQLGFTLISVLIAIFLFGFGLLAILRSLGATTGASTQNQNVGIATTLSNGFWGVLQANPALPFDPALGSGTAVTFSAANIGAAPAALQPWLVSLTDTTSGTGVPPSGLPEAKATIQTFPDVGSFAPCVFVSGCAAVTLTISWTQVASNGALSSTRSQSFYYQVGL